MTAATLTLPEFLLARIAEDEALASAAAGPFGVYPDTWWGQSGARALDVRDQDAAFFARHDPARVLAECEAKRRIVESCRADYEYAQGRNDDTTEVAEEVMWALALPYVDHPDYRDEWRP